MWATKQNDIKAQMGELGINIKHSRIERLKLFKKMPIPYS